MERRLHGTEDDRTKPQLSRVDTLRLQRHRGARAERGQVLPLFAIGIAAMLAMAALLFDAANALLVRRELQDAADAAALAGAQLIADTGCSTSVGGAPYSAVADAARASVGQNLPRIASGSITVTCPSTWPNTAVRVAIVDQSPAFFSPIVGRDGFGVAASATAINGTTPGQTNYAVAVLRPYTGRGPTGGCPSMSISGSVRRVSLYLEGDLHVNSACPASDGGAVDLGFADVSYQNGSRLLAAGDIVTRHGATSPNALSGQPPIDDPLIDVAEPDISRLPVRSNTNLSVLGLGILQPGVYRGGISVSGIALLEPGIYYLDGGGLTVNGGGSLYSVNRGVLLTTPLTWARDCTASNCGVMFFNKVYGATNTDDVFVRGSIRVRPLNSAAVTGTYAPSTYDKIVLWQSRSPAAQPPIDISGSGLFHAIGAIYAPSADLRIWGSSGGTATDNYEFVGQFIVDTLSIGGSAVATFRYPNVGFPPQLVDYGLVQ